MWFKSYKVTNLIKNGWFTQNLTYKIFIIQNLISFGWIFHRKREKMDEISHFETILLLPESCYFQKVYFQKVALLPESLLPESILPESPTANKTSYIAYPVLGKLESSQNLSYI